MNRNRTWITLATVLALLGVFGFIAFQAELKKHLDNEVFRQTYGFLLTIVLGGAVALLYKQIEAERARHEAERALQRQLHTDIVEAYNATKKTRRLLRANTGDSQIRAAYYDEQLQVLIDTQLNFESFVSRVHSIRSYFRARRN